MVKIDLKDRKLLFELSFNARAPYTELARKTGLSKQSVEYRLKNLVKKGVIKNFYPVINMPLLGYLHGRLFLNLRSVTREKLHEITTYLGEHKKIFWLARTQGEYDLFINIWVRTLEEFREFTQEIRTVFGKYIKHTSDAIGTHIVHHQHRFLLDMSEGKKFDLRETSERFRIDAVDMVIIHQLVLDCRKSLVGIAAEVGKSPKVVAYRLKRLEKNQVIPAYRIRIGAEKIDFTYYKILLNLSNESHIDLRKICEYIERNPLVLFRVEAIGMPCDIDFDFVAKSHRQLLDFIDDLRLRFPKLIDDYHIVAYAETLKTQYLPF